MTYRLRRRVFGPRGTDRGYNRFFDPLCPQKAAQAWQQA